MKNVIDYFPPHIKKFVLCIFKGGSQLFCSNPHDIDYVVITKTTVMNRIYYIQELKADCFIFSLSEFNKMLINNSYRYKLCVISAYSNPENVIYGELPKLETDIFSKDYLIQTVLPIEYDYAEKTYFQKYPSKTIVWGLALYYAIVNGKFDFTTEQKEILQKAHDLELNVSYRDELKLNLQQLLQ